jgi:SAM-dependent methyltransferase
MTTTTQEFVTKVVMDAAGMVAIRLCAIGNHLGIFKNLFAEGPATSEQLATRMGLNERYVREWIYGMSAAGYLEFDKQSRKATLPAALVPVLVDEGGPAYQGGLFKMFTGLMQPFNELVTAFQKGGGITYATYDPMFWEGLEANSCVRYRNLLVSQWLPEMPDVKARLEQGGSFADFGCGAGRSTVELAKAFPKARFYGFDLFEPNIAKAKANAREAGVEDRIDFRVHDISKGVPEKFDIVATFDLIHDMADPKGGLRALRQAVRDDGIYVLMDVACENDPADNEGPMAVFKFGASLHFCMTTSLAQNGMGLGTVGLPEMKVKEFCKEAGFSTVRRLPIEHPLNVLYEIRP